MQSKLINTYNWADSGQQGEGEGKVVDWVGSHPSIKKAQISKYVEKGCEYNMAKSKHFSQAPRTFCGVAIILIKSKSLPRIATFYGHVTLSLHPRTSHPFPP